MSAPTGTADRAATAFRAYLAGDEPRMAEVVEACTPAMWHTARAVGLDQAEAEDAVQQAWTQLVAGADRIRDPQTVLAWLMTTTRRAAIRLSRSAGRVHPDEDLTVGTQRAPGETATQEGPDESVLRDGRDRVLWHHIGVLSPRCQELLRVIAFADRPNYAAIAARLGMPVGSIGPTRGRCLAALRSALATDPEWSDR